MTARARSRSAVEDVTLRADEIRWSLDEPEPAPCHPTEDVGPPPGLTDSRADLVAWWRHAVLQGEPGAQLEHGDPRCLTSSS